MSNTELTRLKKFKSDALELLKHIPAIDKGPFLSCRTDGDQLEPEVVEQLWAAVDRMLDGLPYAFRQETYPRNAREKLRALHRLSIATVELCHFLYFSQETLDGEMTLFKSRCEIPWDAPEPSGPQRVLVGADSRFETSEWTWQHALTIGFASFHNGGVQPEWIDAQVVRCCNEGVILEPYQTRRLGIALHGELRDFWPKDGPDWIGKRVDIIRLANFLAGAPQVRVGALVAAV